jgi:hypothetical protein
MGFFKRLLGLGSRSAAEAGPADWATQLLGSLPATGPAAANWSAVEMSNLPPPPDGFGWHPFKEAQITVLQPKGWYVHQEMDDQIFTGCVSKESIETATTVLTLQVFRGTKDGLRAIPNCHPDTAVAGTLGGLLPNLPTDPRFQVLYLDPCVQRTAGSRLIRAQYRQLGSRRSVIAQTFIIEFDQSPDVYVLTFISPENTWDDSWKIGKQILTNLVFSPSPSVGLIVSIDPPLAPDDLSQAKVLEVGRSLGWSLGHEDRTEGLFVWNIEVEAPQKRQPPSRHAGTFTWCMKRVNNEIKLYDPIDLAPLTESSTDFMAAISIAARQAQEDFKRRWLALVGPVTIQPATPEMVELCVKTAVQVTQVQRGVPVVVAHAPTPSMPKR